ncbi:MAG: DUF481 domain-containing protein [Myxococcales bacterium]
MRKVFAIAALAALSAPAFADTTTTTDTDGWKGQGELGYAAAHGNADNESLVADLGLANVSGNWTNKFGADYLYSKSTDEDTGIESVSAKRYDVFATSGYHFTDHSYFFGSGRNERDQSSSYTYQWTAAIGYGIDAIKNDRTHLTFEIGPGYRWSELRATDLTPSKKEDEVIARGWADFGQKLTDSTSIVDTLLVESGSDNTYLQNDLGLQVQMSHALALKVGFEWRHNSYVLPGIDPNDTLTTANLVYNFGG